MYNSRMSSLNRVSFAKPAIPCSHCPNWESMCLSAEKRLEELNLLVKMGRKYSSWHNYNSFDYCVWVPTFMFTLFDRSTCSRGARHASFLLPNASVQNPVYHSIIYTQTQHMTSLLVLSHYPQSNWVLFWSRGSTEAQHTGTKRALCTLLVYSDLLNPVYVQLTHLWISSLMLKIGRKTLQLSIHVCKKLVISCSSHSNVDYNIIIIPVQLLLFSNYVSHLIKLPVCIL